MGCNHILATVNSTTVNMKVQVALQDFDFKYFGYIPISGNGGSYSSCIFNFLQNLQTVFHYWCTIFHSYRKCKRFTIIQQPSQLLLSFDLFFFLIVIFTGARWYVIVVFICIFLIINDVNYLFIYLLASYMFSLENVCPSLLPSFKNHNFLLFAIELGNSDIF